MIKVFAEVSKLDPNSVGLLLDVDGVKNVDEVVKQIKERLERDPQVKLIDVIWSVLLIYLNNKREERRLQDALGTYPSKGKGRED